MLGNGRLEAFCFDGVKRLCHIRGKLRKKVWVNQVRLLIFLCSTALDLIYSRPTSSSCILTLYHFCAPCSSFILYWCLFKGDIILVGLRDYQDAKADGMRVEVSIIETSPSATILYSIILFTLSLWPHTVTSPLCPLVSLPFPSTSVVLINK